MRHLCGSLCILVLKMATLTILTPNRWGVWLKFSYRLKGYYNVFRGTENIFCDITYFPHKCATFVVPFVFWYTKMVTLTIFIQNRWGVWLKFLCRFKGYYKDFSHTPQRFRVKIVNVSIFVYQNKKGTTKVAHLCGKYVISQKIFFVPHNTL